MILFLALCLVTRPLVGQELSFTGKLRELTATSITFIDRSNVMDAGSLRTYTRTPNTILENCTEADIRPGAEIAVTVMPESLGDTVATRVYLYSCREQIGMVATVIAVTPPTLTILSDRFDSPFGRGAEVVVTTTSSTQLSTCRNEALDLTTLEVGRSVNIYGQVSVNGDGIDATWVGTADDCPQTTIFNCVIRGLSDTSVTVEVDGYGEFEALFPGGYGSRDTAMVYLDQCDFTEIWWSDVAVGDSAQGTFQIAPRGPTEVFQLTILRNCLPGLDFGFSRNAVIGRITSIDGDVYSILTPLNVTALVNVGDTTTYADCTGRPFERTSITIGDDVYVVAARALDTLRASLMIRSSNCTVEHVSAVIEREGVDEMTIRLENGRTLAVLLDANVSVSDCAGRQRSPNDPALRERRATFLVNTASDPIIAQRIDVDIDCPGISLISGTISSINDDVITVATLADSVFLERASTILIDTTGAVLDWSDAQAGDFVCGEIATLGPMISAAYLIVGIDCDGQTKPRAVIARGVVVRNEVDDIQIDGPNGELTFAATEATSVQGAPSRLSIEPGTVVEIRASSRKQSLQPIASSVRVESVTSVDDDVIDRTQTTPLAFPQPATDVITLTETVANGPRVSLLTLDGRTLSTTTGRTMRVDAVPNGSYVLHCMLPDGSVRVQQLMILR
jgi:hypothetical protein